MCLRHRVKMMVLSFFSSLRCTCTISVYLMILSLCAACSDPDKHPVRVGYSDWIGSQLLSMADQKGFLATDKANLVAFPTSAQTLKAFHNGLIDIASLTIDEAMRVHAANSDARIFMVQDFSNGADVLLAHENMQALAGIKGKTIGVENNAFGAYFLIRILQEAGLDMSEIRFKSLEFGEQRSAFENNEVDLLITYEPLAGVLLAQGAHSVFDSRRLPAEVIDVFVTTVDYYCRHREKIAYFTKGWHASRLLLEQEPEKALALIRRAVNLGPEHAAKALAKLTFPDVDVNRALMNGSDERLWLGIEKVSINLVNVGLISRPVSVEQLLVNDSDCPGANR